MKRIFSIGFTILFPFLLKAQNDSINNLLDLSLEELMNIKVVTASGFVQNALEAPATITVISRQQIQ